MAELSLLKEQRDRVITELSPPNLVVRSHIPPHTEPHNTYKRGAMMNELILMNKCICMAYSECFFRSSVVYLLGMSSTLNFLIIFILNIEFRK